MKKNYLTRPSLERIISLKPVALAFFLLTSLLFSVNGYAQDADNDGVLDVDELNCPAVAIDAPVFNSFSDDPPGPSVVASYGSFDITYNQSGTNAVTSFSDIGVVGIEPFLGNIMTYDFSTNVSNLVFTVADLDSAELIRLNVYDAAGNPITNLIPYVSNELETDTPHDLNVLPSYGLEIDVVNPQSYPSTSLANYVELSFTDIEISKIVIEFIDTNGSPRYIDDFSTPVYYIRSACAAIDTDNDNIPDFLDLDSDNDGILDSVEGNVDTDGDGVPDRLDTDSDNDGCPDAIEAAGAFTNADLDADGRLLGGVDNITGIPVVAGAGQTTTLDVTTVGPDADGDGISDACDAVFNDVDNDGVADAFDLDNDNDGILDADEGCLASSAYPTETKVFFDNTGTITTMNATAPIVLSSITDYVSQTTMQPVPLVNGIQKVFMNGYDTTAGPTTFQYEPQNQYQITANNTITLKGFYYDTFQGNANSYIDMESKLFTSGGVITKTITLTAAQIASLRNGEWIPFDFEFDVSGIASNTIDITKLEVRLETNVGGTVNPFDPTLSEAFGFLPISLVSDLNALDCIRDTDNDGTPDYLDTDSDNDGCPDAIEAAGAFTIGDLTSSNNLADADEGTVDASGVPTIAGSPQAITADVTTAGPDADGDGISDACDAVFNDNDNDGVADAFDLDDDNDGILDVDESGGIDATGDADGDGVPNYQDPDFCTLNANGVCDNLDFDGDGVINQFDLDTDGDGISDVIEAGGIDADGDAHIDNFTDVNGDGLDDAIAATPLPIPNTDTTGGPDYLDIDADDDGIVDNIEAQLTIGYNPPRNVDTDGDGLDDEYDGDDETVAGVGGGTSNALVPVNTDGTDTPDYIDTDSDNDGDLDILEAWDTNNDGTADTVPSNTDFDGDGLDDNFDDNDAVLDPTNNGQLATDFPDLDTPGGDRDWREALDIDWDNDGIADGIDLDDDNDGIPDAIEGTGDTDGDGVPNHLDLDSDNDGIYDIVESGQNVIDLNNDGIIDAANAGTVGANGLYDPLEDGPESGNLTTPTLDSDNDGIPDSLELNSDGDGCSDVLEAGFEDGDAVPNGLLGTGTFGAGLTVDINGVVNTPGLASGYTEPNDLDGGTYDYREFGEAVTIAVAPQNATVILNANANFDLTLGTGVNPTYQWFESTNGVDFFPIINGGIYTGANGPILTINANTLALSGNKYYVEISAPGYACDGSVTSLPATLTIVNDFDGDGIPDDIDLDDDNDGIPDTLEGTGDLDGDGIPNHHDLDADGDGIFDTNEAGFADLDLNNDGIIDGPNADFGTNGLFDGVETSDDSGTINYTILNTDGDANPNFLDVDDDNDGVNTEFENPSPDGNGDPSDAQDTDNDGTPDYLDVDDDGDGVNTEFEVSNADGDGNPNTGVAVLNTDSDLLPNYLDTDDDGDGILTEFESPNNDGDGNPNTGDTLDTDEDSKFNYLDSDDDGDSILTIFENPDPNGNGNPDDAQDSDNDLIPDYLDVDDDNDGVYTIFENPDPNGDGNPSDAQNTDNDTLPDYLDIDDDNDGINTEDENPDPNGDGNPSDAQDFDNDGTPDYLDIDDDNDGISNVDEDVDGDGDPTNDDTDGDGNPNYLDIDDDGDGIKTIIEGPGNADNDAFPNYLDQDADNDGIPDNVEGQPTTGYINPSGEDTDGNGLDDAYEDAPGTAEGISPVDTDADTTPDYLDTDSDNDTVPDSTEGHDYNADGQPDVLPSGTDSDNDGLDDAYDGSIGDFLDPNGLKVEDSPANDLPNTDVLLDTLNNFNPPRGDAEVDYRDEDDDNDSILTIDEDGNGDGDPTNDDCDEDGFPDYLDPTSCTIIPDGFSPNGDSDNETFIIPALKQYKNFEMEVYDRWGNIVYDYSNNGRSEPLWWDGHSSGTRTISKDKKVPVGTYYYIIRYNEGGIEPVAGWVYINY